MPARRYVNDMMPPDTDPEAADLEERAVAWLVRADALNCTAEEQSQLDSWLACPRHRAAYVRMHTAWSHADRLRQLQPLDGRVNADLLNETVLPALRVANRSRRDGAQRLRAPMLGYILVAVVFTALISGITAWLVAERTL